jgi:hypothetical protein
MKPAKGCCCEGAIAVRNENHTLTYSQLNGKADIHSVHSGLCQSPNMDMRGSTSNETLAGIVGDRMMAGGICDTLGGCEGIHPEGSVLSAALDRGDTVIVGVDLSRPVETIEGHSDLISETEQCRAKEYDRDLDRTRFIRRRITLRRLLGTILGRDPRSIVIRTEPSGNRRVLRYRSGHESRGLSR